MALFGLKKKESSSAKDSAGKPVKAKKVAKPAAVVVAKAGSTDFNTADLSFAGAIIRPRITEKSGLLSQSGVYTFEVTKNANKASIAKAVKALYKVSPVRINVINLPDRRTFIRGRKGSATGVRKALVTVAKGDKIDFV